MDKRERNLSMDLLRCIAAIMVVVMHVIADNFYTTDTKSLKFLILDTYSSLSRSAVPLFFMISGAFLVSTDIEKIKEKLRYYVLIFCIFSILYGINDIICVTGGGYGIRLDDLLQKILNYKYHLWYLPTYISILVIIPIVNSSIVHNKSLLKYMFFLSIIYVGIQNVDLFSDNPDIRTLVHIIPFIGGYIGYFIVGKYLINIEIHKIVRISCYLAGILSVVILIFLTRRASIEQGWGNEKYFNNFCIFVFIEAIALFVFFGNLQVDERLAPIINFVSPLTLQIYLIHVFFIDWFTRLFSFTACSINPILGVPLKVICVFASSIIAALVWNKVWNKVRNSFAQKI